MPNSVTVRVHLFNQAWDTQAAECWEFSNIPESDSELQVDEHALERDLHQTFLDVGGDSARNTFRCSRTASWGGWGAEGISALEIVISVASGVASSALWEALKALYKRHTGVAPETKKMLGTGAERDGRTSQPPESKR